MVKRCVHGSLAINVGHARVRVLKWLKNSVIFLCIMSFTALLYSSLSNPLSPVNIITSPYRLHVHPFHSMNSSTGTIGRLTDRLTFGELTDSRDLYSDFLSTVLLQFSLSLCYRILLRPSSYYCYQPLCCTTYCLYWYVLPATAATTTNNDTTTSEGSTWLATSDLLDEACVDVMNRIGLW